MERWDADLWVDGWEKIGLSKESTNLEDIKETPNH